MFRTAFIGIIAAIIFGLLSVLPIIGTAFAVVATISIALAGILFVVGLIKLLFFLGSKI